MIVAYNHLSNNVMPSSADLHPTSTIKSALSILEVKVIDLLPIF